jgi:hypothetical protein
MYGKDLEDMRMGYDDAYSRLAQIKLAPKRCNDTEIKFLLQSGLHSHN